MADLGLFGATLPAEYGCAGLNNVAYGLMTQELERGDSSIRSFASVQSSLVMYPIYAFGSRNTRTGGFRCSPQGRPLAVSASRSPTTDQIPADDHACRAKQRGIPPERRKMWITNGTIADVAVVWAKLGSEIKGFLVEKGTKGFTAPEMTGSTRCGLR